MRNRIYGLETEYGIVLIQNDGTWVCDEQSLYQSQAHFEEFYGKQFMGNGSRIYKDIGSHPEYSTAECLELLDLVAQDKAGEQILDEVFAQYSVHLFKNNGQHADVEMSPPFVPITFGCHENFLMARSLDEKVLAPIFLPFLVVRQIVAGAGWVTGRELQQQNVSYAISQRTWFIRRKVSNSTHSGWERGILCTARWEEPHADSRMYKRLHLALGDSNMSELSTYLKMATVGILLEMLEEGYPLAEKLADFELRDPVASLHAVSCDLTCRKPVIELDVGSNISALDLFWVFVTLMEEYKTRHGLNKELSDALTILIDILQRLERRKIDQETQMEVDSLGLDEELDWLIKKSLLEEVLRKFRCDWPSFAQTEISWGGRQVSVYDQLRAKDKKYHDISPDGLYNIYVAEPDLSPDQLKSLGIRTPRVVAKERIKYMKHNPPQNTRAKIRGEFIKFFEKRRPEAKAKFSWNWSRLDIFDFDIGYRGLGTHADIQLDDPFATENYDIEIIKRSLK